MDRRTWKLPPRTGPEPPAARGRQGALWTNKIPPCAINQNNRRQTFKNGRAVIFTTGAPSADTELSESDYEKLSDKEDGSIVFESESLCGNGSVTVTQHADGWRVLRFDDGAQGLGYWDDANGATPEVLGYHYIRAMASAACAFLHINGVDLTRAITHTQQHAAVDRSQDLRFIFCGLGCGALPAFFGHHFPNASHERKQVVEIDSAVVEAATRCFGFPANVIPLHEPDPLPAAPQGVPGGKQLLDTVIADAATFMSQRQSGDVSCIFLDAYDSEGNVPAHLEASSFLKACVDALAPGGIIVANLFNGCPGESRRAGMLSYAEKLRRAVGAPVYSVKVVQQTGNAILVVCKPDEGQSPPEHSITREDLLQSAEIVSDGAGFSFDANTYVEQMFWMVMSGADGEAEDEDWGGGGGSSGAYELVPGEAWRWLAGSGTATDEYFVSREFTDVTLARKAQAKLLALSDKWTEARDEIDFALLEHDPDDDAHFSESAEDASMVTNECLELWSDLLDDPEVDSTQEGILVRSMGYKMEQLQVFLNQLDALDMAEA
ncbi:hypothetical protein CYMTET_51050 [Cymbomonas tetramitiformis]|uniref:Spermidine synthase n=1 Tax=Cymbomonas tetramitiformis TaxID=36881 RepID=A0AAE0BLW7_9CHLO|nr:hypothetical protein CYMTET_51050 [Cymbomonas tetramitiformis]